MEALRQQEPKIMAQGIKQEQILPQINNLVPVALDPPTKVTSDIETQGNYARRRALDGNSRLIFEGGGGKLRAGVRFDD